MGSSKVSWKVEVAIGEKFLQKNWRHWTSKACWREEI